jgi:rubredoxin
LSGVVLPVCGGLLMKDADQDDCLQWVCRICGYIYDPRLHEEVAFEELPAEWRCPGCGFGKSVFVRRKQR